MAQKISLTYHSSSPNAGMDIVPSDHITTFDYRQSHTSSTPSDIWGVPVVVGTEIVLSSSVWDLVVHYVDLDVAQAVLAAYTENYLLVLTDELGNTPTIRIKEYPSVERNKVVTGEVVYTLKFAIQADSVNGVIPTVLPGNGPRLFDR